VTLMNLFRTPMKAETTILVKRKPNPNQPLRKEIRHRKRMAMILMIH
jgi:hypothetical protein